MQMKKKNKLLLQIWIYMSICINTHIYYVWMEPFAHPLLHQALGYRSMAANPPTLLPACLLQVSQVSHVIISFGWYLIL